MKDSVFADFDQTQFLEHSLKPRNAIIQMGVLEQIVGRGSARLEAGGQRLEERKRQNAAVQPVGAKQVYGNKSIACRVFVNKRKCIGFHKEKSC